MKQSQYFFICITALMVLASDSVYYLVSVQPGVEQGEALLRRRTHCAAPDPWQSCCVHTSRVPKARNQCKKRVTCPELFCGLHWFSAGWTISSLQTTFSAGVSDEMGLGFVWVYFSFTLDSMRISAWKMSLFQALVQVSSLRRLVTF